MQIKNKLILLYFCFFSLITFSLNLNAEEFDISAEVISIDKAKDIVTGKGSVEVIDSEGKIIKSDKVTYEKAKGFLKVEGSV